MTAVAQDSTNVPALALHFSPRALVRSRLVDATGTAHEAGVKDREVRWQKGAIAVCILVVYTRLRAWEGADETPVLEGEQGSPARSIDNLLNKPGDWAHFMFGAVKGQPGIRHYIYRKRAVSASNPISAVQWDASALDPKEIEITRENDSVDSVEAMRELLLVLLQEFNPRRAQREFEALTPLETTPPNPLPPAPETAVIEPAPNPPERAPPPVAALPGTPHAQPPLAAGPPGARPGRMPWAIAGSAMLVAALAVVFAVINPGGGEGRHPPPEPPGEALSLASLDTVYRFIDLLTARDLEGAYALMSPSYQGAYSREAFAVTFGGQRFDIPRVGGYAARNLPDRRVHEYRAILEVESEVRRIPPLERLGTLRVTEMGDYAERMNRFLNTLRDAGVDETLLRQMRRERLERPDAARYVQLITGLDDAQMEALFPEITKVRLDVTLFFEVVRMDEDTWLIASVEDAADRLMEF